ncbi:endolytic transglycosylase MltG [Nocardia sp. NPDC127579]|uniref:endolytic transglycosylase MltG n=1 Tax=Nocardia sp. NPDC127579 TaxID=3345402 RepID=UPI00362F3EF1
MTDRWARAEEHFRQREADRRYRRDEKAWADDRRRRAATKTPEPDRWANYDDDTNVIPRYTDDDDPLYDGPGRYDDEDFGAASDFDDDFDEPEQPEPPQRKPVRTATRTSARTATRATRRAKPDRPAKSPRGRRSSRAASRKAAERKKRRRSMWIIGAVLTVLLVGAAGFAIKKFAESFGPPADYAGPGGPLVVVQVHPGDTASQIADSMLEKDVVKSSSAFYQAAMRNSAMTSVQPGYYAIPSKSPAADAVTTLVGKGSRVGNLVVAEGRLLHDQHDVKTGSTTEGLYTKISAASCVGMATQQKCVSAQDLAAAAASTDLAALGVPAWAMESVRAAPDRSRQLDGLLAAGTWDFDPSGTPQQILRQLITQSAAGYEATGLLQSGAQTNLTPYQTLIAASLVEREASPGDRAKVARVILNRLAVDQPLQFDSTVNYGLDTTELATTDDDRETKTPWNTYAMSGLPANPIAAPSLDSLRAMEKPEPGDWLYFVTVDAKGTTMFTASYSEHLRNIRIAQQSGILDSGR